MYLLEYLKILTQAPTGNYLVLMTFISTFSVRFRKYEKKSIVLKKFSE